MDSSEKESGRLVGHSGKEPACQCRRHKETLQPPLVLLPGESHGQRSMAGCRPWGHTELETTEMTAYTRTHTHTVGHMDWHLLSPSDLCWILSVGGSSIGSTFLTTVGQLMQVVTIEHGQSEWAVSVSGSLNIITVMKDEMQMQIRPLKQWAAQSKQSKSMLFYLFWDHLFFDGIHVVSGNPVLHPDRLCSCLGNVLLEILPRNSKYLLPVFNSAQKAFNREQNLIPPLPVEEILQTLVLRYEIDGRPTSCPPPPPSYTHTQGEHWSLFPVDRNSKIS